MSKAKTVAKKVGTDLTQGSILKTLIIFALPIIMSNLIQQLYSTVDLIIIGKYVGSEGTVGVSTGGELIDLMTPLATSFATAGQIYIAQLAGEKNSQRIKEASGTLITLMLGLSVIFMVGTIVFYKQVLTLLNCPEEAFSQAAAYMIITAVGMPFIFGYNAICAMLRGLGESKRPMIFIIVAAVVNIVFDVILVAVFRLEAVGTAIATVASQIGAFIASFAYMYQRKEEFDFSLSPSYFKIRKQPLKVILVLGIPQLVRVFSVQFSMLWVKANINAYGIVASATYSVGNKIEKFMNVFVQGVDGAAGAMIGQNLGARKHNRVKRIVWTTLASCLVICAVVAGLFLFVPKPLYSIFTDDAEVIEAGVIYLRIMAIGCVTAAFASSFKGMATGAGEAGLCLAIGVLDGVCRVLVCLFFVYVMKQGMISYYWGAALCQLIPGIICFIYFISGKWKKKKLLSET